MKKLVLLFFGILLFGCTDDVVFNNPSVQGRLDDVFWRAVNSNGTLSNNSVTINGQTASESLSLTFPLPTGSSGTATYNLGTTNQNVTASVVKTIENEFDIFYETQNVRGPVENIDRILNGGTGYNAQAGVPTTGGSGTGLKVRTTVELGVVKTVTVVFAGTGYKAGDIITITGGNNNATFRILNVQGSNGQIKVTEYDPVNKTISGTFRFNAKNIEDNPLGGESVNFQDGVFYKIKLIGSE